MTQPRSLRPVSMLRGAATGLALGSLAACASITEVSGPYPVTAGGYTVTLDRSWSDVSSLFQTSLTKTRVLTIDGPLLNRMLLIGGIAPGESIARAASKEKPAPKMRADLTETEQVEMIADSLTGPEYLRVETSNLRPEAFGVAEGVRFDISAQTKDGLNMDGTALVAVSNGKLNAMVFLAPEEHYFPSLSGKADAAFRSATFK